MTPLSFRPAHELARGLASGELSSLELTDHFIARIEAHDGPINAVVVCDFERARARARQADEARSRGELWGPLHGLPMTVKESFNVAGLPTTFGFEQHRHNIAQQPAVTVQRLLDAGAVILGKTNVPVALADWQSFNPVYGTTSNPWDLSRAPGGSSGGSAAALAAGMTPLELGSDIGASIRNPAHYCGVYGHKPTWGVVPMAGHELPGTQSIDSADICVAGPLARHAADLELSMQVLASPLAQFGPMGWTPAQWGGDARHPRELRVAIIDDDAQAPVDDAIRGKLAELAAFLRAEGVTVRTDLKPVDGFETHAVYMHLLRSATGAMLDDATWAQFAEKARALPASQDDTESRTYRASTMTHREWVQWDERRAVLRRQWAQCFTQVDVVIAPVATSLPIHHNHQGQRWERMVQVNGRPQPHTHSLFWAGYPGVVGLPATAFPLGLVNDGAGRQMPVGAQIIGPVRHDPVTLRLARWLGEEWRGFTPPPGY